MGGLEVVEHEVYGVRGCADEDNLKDSIVQRIGVVEGPQQIDVSTEVNNQIQELRLERDAGRTLSEYVRLCVISLLESLNIRSRSSSCAGGSGLIVDGTSPLSSH